MLRFKWIAYVILVCIVLYYVDIPFDLVVIYSSQIKIELVVLYDSLSIVDEVAQLLPLSNSIQAGFN